MVDPVKVAGYGAWRTTIDHGCLTVTDEQLDEFAAAIGEFWSLMPDRLDYDVTE